MRFVVRTIAALAPNCKAATAVEYGLILALVVIALFVGVASLGGANKSLWGNIHTKVVAVQG